jgi:hypothetical protein
MHQPDAPQLGKTALITVPWHNNAGNPFPPAHFELLERSIEFGGLGWTSIPFCRGGWSDNAGNAYAELNRLYVVALTHDQQVHPLRRVIHALGRVMGQKAVFTMIIDSQVFLDYLAPAVSTALSSPPLPSVISNGHGSPAIARV